MSNTKRNTGAKASRTVTVACKVPNGLILRLHQMSERDELVMGGGVRQIRQAVEMGDRVIINGPAAEQGKMPVARNILGMAAAALGMVRTEYSFALTHGVDAEFFAAWLEQNKTHPAVRNGLIFAHAQQASVVAQAREKEAVRTGLEPIDPERPGGKIEPTDEQKKRQLGLRLQTGNV